MTFDKKKYWERRKQGLRGALPGTLKEIRYEVKKRLQTEDSKKRIKEAWRQQ